MRVRHLRAVVAAVGVAALVSGTALASASATATRGGDGAGQGQPGAQIRHVLLISVDGLHQQDLRWYVHTVDGLHQQDLRWYVHTHPSSTLADLVRHGIEYSHAMTPIPSDSFPGMIAQVTGGDPGVTGIYYDDTYN